MKIKRLWTLLILGSILLVAASISGCQSEPATISANTETLPGTLEGEEEQPTSEVVEETESSPKLLEFMLTSESFNEGETIPARFTCDGEDISPPLSWSGAPTNTKSFVLIMDDPDAPVGTWVHWNLIHLPGEMRTLPENLQLEAAVAEGIKQGTNSWGRPGYGGPCPPGGTHRYFFKLYALDDSLNLEVSATKEDVVAAMEGHILMETELMGTYSTSGG